MHSDVFRYIQEIWSAVAVVWLISALRSKRAARTESPATRLLHLAFVTAALTLIFSSISAVGPLAWRVVPDSAFLAWVGLLVTAAGCAIAIWARLLLGGNWSASVTVKQDHRLIRRGPYTVVRHPIYSGFLLGLLGAALVIGQVRGFLGVALAFAGWRMKSRLEEDFMTAQFGAEYIRYEREVKAFIPFVL